MTYKPKVLEVAAGGTGASTLTGILTGNGTSAITGSATISASLIAGSTTGVAPTAGIIGEQLKSVVSGVSITNGTPKSITSLSITAGVWDVTVSAVSTNTGNVITAMVLGISTADNTLQGTLGDQQTEYIATSGIAADIGLCVPAFRVLLSGSTTYYMVAQLNFASGTSTIAGRLSATRVG